MEGERGPVPTLSLGKPRQFPSVGQWAWLHRRPCSLGVEVGERSPATRFASLNKSSGCLGKDRETEALSFKANFQMDLVGLCPGCGERGVGGKGRGASKC